MSVESDCVCVCALRLNHIFSVSDTFTYIGEWAASVQNTAPTQVRLARYLRDSLVLSIEDEHIPNVANFKL